MGCKGEIDRERREERRGERERNGDKRVWGGPGGGVKEEEKHGRNCVTRKCIRTRRGGRAAVYQNELSL